MSSFIKQNRLLSVAIIIFSFLLITSIVSAATTISTNITTGGVLTVTGTAASSFAGALGVGTSTPIASLAVQGIGGINPFVIASSTGTSLIMVLQNGNVGIGTTSPAAKLTVSGTGAAGTQMRSEFANTNTTLTGAGTAITLINTDQTVNNFAGIDFKSQNTSGAEIISSKIVGIFGARSASQVEGLLSFLTRSAGGAINEKMRIDGVGNVGIGTSTPATQFQVTTSSLNATTTITIGKAGQNKGSCLELYDAGGTAVYAYVAPGATTFTLSAASCK